VPAAPPLPRVRNLGKDIKKVLAADSRDRRRRHRRAGVPVAGDGERENFHRSARALPATRRHAGHITRRYETAGHYLITTLPGPWRDGRPPIGARAGRRGFPRARDGPPSPRICRPGSRDGRCLPGGILLPPAATVPPDQSVLGRGGQQQRRRIPAPLPGPRPPALSQRPARRLAITSLDEPAPFAPPPLQRHQRYYGPVRQHAPRRYSAPRGFSRLAGSLSHPLRRGRSIDAHLPVFPHASRRCRQKLNSDAVDSRPGSRHLHAGHRLAGKRVSARLIPGRVLSPRF
jgi:hypothetical protein